MDKAVTGYVEPNIANIVSDWSEGERGGESCYIKDIEKYFKWMRGHHNGLYGYPGDGKGVWYDYLAVVKAMNEKDWRCCMFKPEDMNPAKINGRNEIVADNIYKKLAWTYSGECPFKKTSERFKIKQIDLDKQMEAIDWVKKHFLVVYPEDQSFKGVMDIFRKAHDIYGFSSYEIDPWTSLEEDEKGRFMLRTFLRQGKKFAMQTDSTLTYINHPSGIKEVREAKGGPYKVVNQYMIAGGPSFDRALDSQHSVYRPHRHDAQRINDPQLHLYSLKVRDEEILGTEKGVYENIMFDRKTRRYYFNEICPITGARYMRPGQLNDGSFDFSQKYEVVMPVPSKDMPF